MQAVDAALDLFLGSRCVGCGVPGRMLCPPCREVLPGTPFEAWPTPTPDGLVPPWAVAPFDGAVRALVVGHKDEGQFGHRRLLGSLLARSVAAAVADVAREDEVVLVPVPSRPGAERRRGYDPTGSVVATAVRVLRRGRRVRAARLVVSRGTLADQADLGATARAGNVAGSMHCPRGGLLRLGRRVERVRLVVCDDVITTGVTAREAQRALESVGLGPMAVATVAATVRKQAPSGLQSLSSGPPTR